MHSSTVTLSCLMLGALRKPCCSPSNMTSAVVTPLAFRASYITWAWLGGTTLSSRPCSAAVQQHGVVSELVARDEFNNILSLTWFT